MPVVHLPTEGLRHCREGCNGLTLGLHLTVNIMDQKSVDGFLWLCVLGKLLGDIFPSLV